MGGINIWAVLVAAVSAFLIGGFWFSPAAFGRPWMRLVGLTEEQVNSGSVGKIFGLSFVYILIMAFCLAAFINDPSVTAQMGAFYGFLAGFGWIFFAYGVTGLFERKPWQYALITGGYWVIALTLMGLIIGAWR